MRYASVVVLIGLLSRVGAVAISDPQAERITTNRHWAFMAPTRPELPNVKNRTWVRNPIDAFVLARLEKEKIKPSPEADRVTLIRRLFLDLLGLPPGTDEVQGFLKD